jgi:hypothetical protein
MKTEPATTAQLEQVVVEAAVGVVQPAPVGQELL